jgi:hypothetical protein
LRIASTMRSFSFGEKNVLGFLKKENRPTVNN